MPRSRRLKTFRRPCGHFGRAFSLDLAVLALELARPRVPRTPRASILYPETAVFSRLSLRQAVRCDQRPECVSTHWGRCFVDVGGFVYIALFVRKKLEQTGVLDSKIEARSLPGGLGRAGLSAQTAKLSEKVRSKCLRGLRKFISERDRSTSSEKARPRDPEERADPRRRRRLISESLNGLLLLLLLLSLSIRHRQGFLSSSWLLSLLSSSLLAAAVPAA